MGGATEPDGPQEVGDLLRALLGRHGLGRRRKSVEAARRAWIAAAGDELAGHTRVRSLRDGVLMVEVDSPALCHQLDSFEKWPLLARVQEAARDITVTSLRFRLGAFEREPDADD